MVRMCPLNSAPHALPEPMPSHASPGGEHSGAHAAFPVSCCAQAPARPPARPPSAKVIELSWPTILKHWPTFEFSDELGNGRATRQGSHYWWDEVSESREPTLTAAQ